MTITSAPRDVLDRQLGKVTMYRLVTIALGLLAVVAIGYVAAGQLTLPLVSTGGMIVSLGVLLVASVASSLLLARAWRVTPHLESSVITALLLYFLFLPSTDTAKLGWLAVAAVLANASKYVLAWRGRHIFNPTAAGALLVYLLQGVVGVGVNTKISASWWLASEKLLPWVAVAALIVLWRTRRLEIGVLFVVLAGVLVVIGLHHGGQAWSDSIKNAAYTSPLVFLAGFMLSEPLTLPPRRHQQLVVAAVTAVVFAYPVFALVLSDAPPAFGIGDQFLAASLLVGNLVAFAFARRRGLVLVLEGRRQLTPETHELTFRAKVPVRFLPGQYAELTLPHEGTDSRGSRRAFSISSPPDAGGRVTFALRVPEPSSSFKRGLLALEPGHRIRSTGVGGDFLWPSDPAVPLLLVAGGIGITPFLSQIRHHPGRDVVLIYGVSSADEVPFTAELADATVVLVGPARPEHLPAGWTFVEAPFLSADLIADAVPDLATRTSYISGPPAMVNAVRPGLAKTTRAVRTDYFSGY